jgi:signal transduction histidine kinase
MFIRPSSTERPSRAKLARDGLVALALTVLGWVQVASFTVFFSERRPPHIPQGLPPFGPRVMEPTWVAFALIALAFLPLAGRRRFPLSVLAISTVVAAVYDQIPNPPTLVFIAPLVALYTVGTVYPRRIVWTAWLTALVPTLVLSLPHVVSGRALTEAIRVTATFAVAAALGDSTRTRRAYVAEVEARAAEAERTREEEALRRVEEERLRIARELHDVTAHSLSLIAVQAGGAAKVAEKDPAAARASIETIRRTAKASLEELRSMLGVLRGGEDAPLSPTGTLAHLPELVRGVEDAGIEVSLEAGDLGGVPAYVDVSAYRIVQEALTNVVRHAKATAVRVIVRREGGGLLIEVRDNGAGTHAGAMGADEIESLGHGIPGMRERAAALGGTFEAGPDPAGGFVARAVLPFQKPESS